MRILLLSVFAFVLMVMLSCSQSTERINVVLILIDTLSADHLGCYGYARETSPTIDSLAATGIIFEHCQAQGPWTLPGMASIFTGLTERSHGCSYYNEFSHGLDPEVPTITSVLKDNGYSTAALVNIGYLGESFGVTRGNDYFWINEDESDNADVTVDSLISYFEHTDVDEPFFVTVHFFDVHLPYEPPAPWDTLFQLSGRSGGTEWPAMEFCSDETVVQHMTAMYDSEIRWTDSQLSRLFAGLRQMGRADNTLFILVADHGEEFMEHGDWGHAHNLYQQALHIPLIISGPGIEPGSSISHNVGQYDILPTLFTYLSIPVPDHVEGIDIFGVIPENRVIPSSGVIADTLSAACISGNSKVIWFVEPDSSETFNLADDPCETTLLPTDSLLFEEVLSYWAWPCICTPTSNELKIIERHRLEALGYIR